MTKSIKLFWANVFRICMGYTGNSAEAKDLAHDTFVNVWKSLSSFKSESKIETWLFRITTNVCLRYVENKERKKLDLTNIEVEDDSNDMELKTTLLYQFISDLPEVERLIISLELEDIKQSEIAQIIGLSDENVRVKIHRIKKKLALKFENYEH